MLQQPLYFAPNSMGLTHATYYFSREEGTKRLTQKTMTDRTASCTNYIHLFRHHFLVPRFTYPYSCSSAVLRATLIRPLCISCISFPSGFDLLRLAVPPLLRPTSILA